MCTNKNCDKKCVNCKWANIVPELYDGDWFQDNNVAIFCKNPNNNMEKEWTSPSHRAKIMEYVDDTIFEKMINEGQTLIARYVTPIELARKDYVWANPEADIPMNVVFKL